MQDGPGWLGPVVQFVHVFCAGLVIGGTAFMRLALQPGLKGVPEEFREKLREHVAGKWRKYAHVAIGLLILSGIYNFANRLGEHRHQVVYHAVFGVKVLVAITVMFIAVGVMSRSSSFAVFRRQPGRWLGINLALLAVVVILGAILRNIPPEAGGG